jgi:N-acetylneuraminate synthase/sialic acid synthase
MREIVLDKKVISDETPPFVIAEIGHNHQGNLESALKLIRAAAESGASAAKFQKRSNKKLFIPSLYDEIYNSENSFGETYGLHREALEFDEKEYKACIEEAGKNNITFFATAFDFESADFLNQLNLPIFKVASGDLQNLPLLKYIASFNKPMIISSGGGTFEMIEKAVTTIRRHHNQVAILQCTASYPAKFERLNLNVISRLREKFPENVVGFSGHDNGIAMSLVAYTLGARVIEKHFTLNRALKGTDHAFSLEPQGMGKLVRDLNRANLALGDGNKVIYEEEKAPLRKMGKMIVAARDLPVGEVLTMDDIEFRSPCDGLPPSFVEQIIGKTLKEPVGEFSPISLDQLS